jgi:hypothetical protein
LSGERAIVLAAIRLAIGSAVVVASMVVLFSVPGSYFVLATFIATSCMLGVSFGLGGLGFPRELSVRSMALGFASALLLYLIFVGGAAAVAMFHPFGITSASETSIYSMIASPSNPTSIQVAVLLFDSAGYEAFFRGILQQRLGTRIGLGSVPIIALFDACLHLITLNLLWVGATLVTDLAWGLTFRYGGGKQASFTSHFIWDLAIFIIRPVT